MDRPIILAILGATLMALAVGMLIPAAKPPDAQPKLPWEVKAMGDGSSEVFTLRLGQSPLRAARQVFTDLGKVNLFRMAGEQFAVEAYFDGVNLSGLRADVILSLEIPPENARAFYERGLRISKAESGASKVTLAPDDLERLAEAPIQRITYLPAAKLDAELIRRRFGDPSERLTEMDSGVSHWLYPERGLDIAIDSKGKAVLQYVAPRDFALLRDPLWDTRAQTGREG